MEADYTVSSKCDSYTCTYENSNLIPYGGCTILEYFSKKCLLLDEVMKFPLNKHTSKMRIIFAPCP